jgi:6-phospho-beta-glucosidase
MKNKSVWEVWYEKEPQRFYNEWSNYIACDTYNRYEEDVELMKQINFNSFRTSIQWSRLYSDVINQVIDEDAVVFYTNYFKSLNKAGIKPIINLYHFDMPYVLYEAHGGFESKVVIEYFVQYANDCFELFGDLVTMWTTFNEPIVTVEGSYFDCFHYPNKVDPKLGIQVGFNTLVAHAKVVELFKNKGFNGEIGITLNLTPIYPRSEHHADLKAAKIADAIFNRSFMDPCVLGTFPKELVDILKENELMPVFDDIEIETIKNNKVDFVGLNYYVPRRVKAKEHAYNKDAPWTYKRYFDEYDMPGSRNNPHRDNNEIYPKALYDIAKDVQLNYGNIKWYVAELGISITNEEQLMDENKCVDDSFRTQLFKEHLIQLHTAIEEGSNCFGLHQWTFIDNWSWLNSHKRRYGFYYLDLNTRERYVKKHALWFAEMIKNNGFNTEEKDT